MEALALVILFLGLLYFVFPKEETAAKNIWEVSLHEKTKPKGLSRGVKVKNMDTKPYNPNCRIGNYEPPKPVGRPNTTSSIKNFKR